MRRLDAGTTLVLATHNQGKLREFAELLAPHGVTIVTAGSLGLPEPEETATDFAGNAEIKARAASEASGLPALADDSGFSVTALGGAPGVYSARWAGPSKDFAAAMARVHAKIGDNPDRSAWFSCALCLAFPDGETVLFEGRTEGQVIWPPRGAAGFGYDPIFMPDGETRSYGEMTQQEKHATSHRMRALARMLAAVFPQHETQA
jgi:XTP/dITP diphosphohydrolase